MCFKHNKSLLSKEHDFFCSYIVRRYREEVFPYEYLSDRRIIAQYNIQNDIEKWISDNKLTERKILEFKNKLRLYLSFYEC